MIRTFIIHHVSCGVQIRILSHIAHYGGMKGTLKKRMAMRDIGLNSTSGDGICHLIIMSLK
jgi:hypothetical protein